MTDLLSKTVFATAAVAVATATSCYSQAKLEGDRRAERAEKRLTEAGAKKALEDAARRESLVGRQSEITFFLNYMPKSPSDDQYATKLAIFVTYCDTRSDEDSVSRALCGELSRVGKVNAANTNTAAATLAIDAAQSRDPGRYVGSSVAASQNAALTATEAAVPAPTDRWFAVIATVPASQPAAARSLAAELGSRLQQAGLPPNDALVYRTQLSNNLAITSGREKSESQAKARAKMLRNSGLFPDAFAQADRSWARTDELRR